MSQWQQGNGKKLFWFLIDLGPRSNFKLFVPTYFRHHDIRPINKNWIKHQRDCGLSTPRIHKWLTAAFGTIRSRNVPQPIPSGSNTTYHSLNVHEGNHPKLEQHYCVPLRRLWDAKIGELDVQVRWLKQLSPRHSWQDVGANLLVTTYNANIAM